jgi:hypothetical protein
MTTVQCFKIRLFLVLNEADKSTSFTNRSPLGHKSCLEPSVLLAQKSMEFSICAHNDRVSNNYFATLVTH